MILIRGAGDIASGIALRIYQCGFTLAMTDLSKPISIRRTVCFSEAIIHGTYTVENATAESARTHDDAERIWHCGHIPVFADDQGSVLSLLKPDAIIDARLAKVNIDTRMSDAPIVIAVGPGFIAGVDCHAVIETQRGHYLGRSIYQGSASENTGIPGNIGGYTIERIIRSPKVGIFHILHQIGDRINAGDAVAQVDDTPVFSLIDGVLRGILSEGTPVFSGMKCGDVDPRCKVEHCYSVSDKALSVGGGALEALLHLGYSEK